MNNAVLSVETVIQRLGYSNSSNLFRYNDIGNNEIFSTHISKVLNEIKPYAIYMIDGKPFILFFDAMLNEGTFKILSKQVWNAQIPTSIFCDIDNIKIFNGYSIDLSTFLLTKVTEQPINNCNEHSPFSYWEISNPNFWRNYADQYSATKLNENLLGNISYLTNELKNKFKISFATKLVLRLIFIRYLIDRGVDLDYGNFCNEIETSRAELLSILKDKQSIYNLFAHLKTKFNGNLFDLGQEICDDALTPDVFELLSDFLSGMEHLPKGQLSLFALYDFNIIPVELISNIYEILLGKEIRSKDNAFYTPNYLVEYILDETVSPYLQNHNQFKILDPACGSGAFLVESYRRIIEKNLNGTLYSDNDTMLRETLTENIFGIDINEESIDVTIFSLYLTILDYKDPKTLVEFTLPNLKGINLFVCDFFDDSKLKILKNVEIDFIIGNPPWGNVKNGLHMNYCKKHGHEKRQQNSEISRSFVFRVKDFSREKTQCCFILHSKLLYNQKQPAKNFRQYLLLNTKIKKIIEMSSVRKLVFKHADAPAVIVMFKYNENENLKNQIIYISLKPNIFFNLFNIIVIEKNDIKFIKQNVLIQFDWAWKTILYGFSGDLDNIKTLKQKFTTLGDTLGLQSPKLCMGAGVEDQDGDKNDAQHLLGRPLLDSQNGVDHFFVNANNTVPFSKSKIHRPRNPELFQPPYCIIPKGVDCSNYKMKAAYTEESFISKATMYIVKGTYEQKSFLLNLVGIINSSFYSYLNLMLGSSLGIEREQRFMEEVVQFPFLYDKAISNQTENIQDLKKQFSLGLTSKIEDEIEKLDEMILNAFKFSDNLFVDYALKVQIPQLTGSMDADIYRNLNADDLLKYSKCFDDYFSSVYGKSGKYIKIMLYPCVAKRYAIFELLVCDTQPSEKIKFSTITESSKDILTKFAVFKSNDLFYQIRDIVYFDQSSFFIIKPNQYKNWHPAIARLDLTEVIDQILSGNEGDQ
jgi:hypothetical protein